MAVLTYVIIDRSGPNDSLVNAEGSTVQTTARSWTFAASCSFHPPGHVVTVPDPYTGASVRSAVQVACRTLYQTAPEIGQSWQQTIP